MESIKEINLNKLEQEKRQYDQLLLKNQNRLIAAEKLVKVYVKKEKIKKLIKWKVKKMPFQYVEAD